MDRISWKSTSGLALAAMVCLLAAPASAGIVYNVTNDLGNQNGWSLAGTITVSEYGTFTSDSAIEAWDLTVSFPGTNFNFQFSDLSSLFFPPVFFRGILSATPTTLSLPSGQLLFYEDSSSSIGWYNGSEKIYVAEWGSVALWNSGAFSPIVDGAFILGTASSSAVPEIDPAGIGSVLALVTGALGLLERRRLKRA